MEDEFSVMVLKYKDQIIFLKEFNEPVSPEDFTIALSTWVRSVVPADPSIDSQAHSVRN